MRSRLGAGALWVRRAAAFGLLLATGRFAWVATAWALERYSAATEHEAARPESGWSRPNRSASPTYEMPPAASVTVPAATSKGANKGDRAAAEGEGPKTYERHTLFVDLGPPRSEVYVDGVRVGQTPYAGTWSCSPDDEVRIHVLPQRGGVPLESRAACRDSMRAVAGRTLDAAEVKLLLADPTLPAAVKDALRR